MILQNEYLIIIDEETSSGFYKLCNSIKRFNEVLEDSKSIKIQRKNISIKNSTYGYELKRGKVKGKKQNFFHIILKFNNDEKDIKNYKQLLREIKTIFRKDAIVETLRDDLSFYYSQLSYSLIHEIENLMRKFITYFMITNIGKNWVNESSPTPIKEALDKSKRKEYRKEYIDVLQQLDFIHLGDFLFKAYQNKHTSYLFEKIKESNEEISLVDLKSYIPQSNWDKYFKEEVDCDDIYLKKRWIRLYELRNKIAHTAHFTVEEYEEIQNLVKEIKEKVEKAFLNIDMVELQEEEKEQLSQKIATNTNEDIGNFLQEWNKLEKQINKLANNKNNFSILENIKTIVQKGYVESSIINTIQDIIKFRNELVHGVDTVNIEEIPSYISKIKKLNNALQSGWAIEVLEAFKQLGGEATLNEIYNFIEKNTHRELTVSWQSSVRKAIYFYSSDADLYLGKEDLYQKVANGKWKLREIK